MVGKSLGSQVLGGRLHEYALVALIVRMSIALSGRGHSPLKKGFDGLRRLDERAAARDPDIFIYGESHDASPTERGMT